MIKYFTIVLLTALLVFCSFANLKTENGELKGVINSINTQGNKRETIYFKNIENIIISEESKISKSRKIMNNMNLFYSDIIGGKYKDNNLIILEYEKLLLLIIDSEEYIDISNLVEYKLLTLNNYSGNTYEKILGEGIGRKLIFSFHDQEILTADQVYKILDNISINKEH